MRHKNIYTDVPADVYINSEYLFYKKDSGIKCINDVQTSEIKQKSNFVLTSMGEYAFVRTEEYITILNSKLEVMYSCLLEKVSSRTFLDYNKGKFLFREVKGDCSNFTEYSEADPPLVLSITNDYAFYLDVNRILLYNSHNLILYSKLKRDKIFKKKVLPLPWVRVMELYFLIKFKVLTNIYFSMLTILIGLHTHSLLLM